MAGRTFYQLEKHPPTQKLMQAAKRGLVGEQKANLVSDADALRAGLRALALFGAHLDEIAPGWLNDDAKLAEVLKEISPD